MKIQKYNSSTESIMVKRDDNLNFHHLTLSVFLKSEHYDLLYDAKMIEENPVLLTYDSKPIFDFLNPPLEHECVACNGVGSNMTEFIELPCKDIYHLSCLAIHIEKSTHNLVILTPKEEEAYGPDKCPRCGTPFDHSYIMKLYEPKAMECYQYLMKMREKREAIMMRAQEEEKKMPGSAENSPQMLINGASLKCELCGKLIRNADKNVLECSHAYHLSCLKEYVQKETKGMIFLTDNERREYRLACKICTKEISEKNVEDIFKDNEAAVKFYKEERFGRENNNDFKQKSRKKRNHRGAKTEYVKVIKPEPDPVHDPEREEKKGDMHTFRCCQKPFSLATMKELTTGKKWFELKSGKLAIADCVICQKQLSLDDFKVLLPPADLEEYCLSHCSFCGSKITQHDCIAECTRHYKCANCTGKVGCNICALFRVEENDGVLLKESVLIRCSGCQKTGTCQNATLLSCLHYFCALCMPPPKNKQKKKNKDKKQKKKGNSTNAKFCTVCKADKEQIAVYNGINFCLVLQLRRSNWLFKGFNSTSE